MSHIVQYDTILYGAVAAQMLESGLVPGSITGLERAPENESIVLSDPC